MRLISIAALVAVSALLAQAPPNTSGTQVEVRLEAGEVVRATADRIAGSSGVLLFGPGDRKLAEFRSFPGGPQPVCFIAEEPGLYRLNVVDPGSPSPVDPPRFVMESPRLPTAEDREYCLAVADSTAGMSALLQPHRDYALAIERYTAALPRWRSVQDRAGELRTLVALGNLRYTTDIVGARESFLQALPLSRALHDLANEGESLYPLGLISSRLDDTKAAVRYLNDAVAAWSVAGLSDRAAVALNALGAVYKMTGDWAEMLDAHLRALDLVRSTKNRLIEAQTLHELGVAYAALGDPDSAVKNLQQALTYLRGANQGAQAGRTLSVLGRISLEQGRLRAALAYDQEAIGLLTAAGDARSVDEAWERVGEAWDSLGDAVKADEYYSRALQRFRDRSDRRGEATVLHRQGLAAARVATGLANPAEREAGWTRSLALLEQSRQLLDSAGLRDRLALLLSDMARVERDSGRLDAARARIELALVLIESLRAKVPESGLRTSYFSSKQDSYAFYVDLLLRLDRQHRGRGLDRLAFNAAERSRARGLLDLLSETMEQVERGGSPELQKRERDLRRELNEETNRLVGLDPAASAAQARALRSRIERTESALRQVNVRIRLDNRELASLTQPAVLTIDDIQQAAPLDKNPLLDLNTLVIAYSVGPESSHGWVVGRGVFRTFGLPGRLVLQGAVDRFVALMARSASSDEADRASAELGRLLLGPVASLLARKRLLILADGPIHRVSFATLRVPGRRNPLVEDQEVVNIPSLSSFAVLRKSRKGARQAPGPVLVVADPILNPTDDRLSPGAKAVFRLGATGAQAPLPRLPFTLEEAQGIVDAPGKGRIADGFEASKGLFSAWDRRYRMLHLATHGIVDSRRPELSGLMLSRVDSSGRQRDGFLSVPEIFNLRLPLDLVVLSACRSGVGQDVRGEGLVGLTRAFLYAGASRVVVSLWNVDDEATAELMKHFYALQFGPQHLRPAAALRAAQSFVRSQPRWRSPYYWGAFVFNGEWL